MKRRIISLLLAASLLAGAIPAAEAAGTVAGQPLGSVAATLRLDFPQRLEEIQERNVRVELFQDGQSLGWLPLGWEESGAQVGGFPAAVALRNEDGGELGGGSWPGYLDVTVENLPQGEYALEFTGEGYVPYTQRLTLRDYSQHVTLGTGDGTFTLGDVDGDGAVSRRDRELLSEALGSGERRDLDQFDLDGDGEIGVVDLAYLTRAMEADGEAAVRNTAMLLPPVDTAAMLDALLRSGGSLLSGSLDDLFLNNGQTVTLSGGDEGLELNIPLADPVELEELQIVSPEGPGAVLAGSAAVEYQDGFREDIPFDQSLPAGIYAIGPMPGSSVVSISLGRRVPVKEIVISVSRTEGGGYAVMESIRFLQEIVPENPAPPNSEIKNLTAEAGDGQVSLRWGELPNVSGYRVDYRLRDGGEARSQTVDVPRAEITGLENLKTYLFTVTPVDGGWQGRTSPAVAAAPQPARVPDAPDMVSVGVLDGALSVSWKAAKNATYYEVYYRAQGEGGFQQYGGQLSGTGATINGLTNGVTYEIYILAGNSMGRSGPSRTALGTPESPDYSRPEGIPAAGVLDWQDIERVWLGNPNNVSPSAYTPDKPFRPENMADGDYSTHWTSHSYGDGNWWDSKAVFASFSRPVDLSAVIWVPRLDGDYAANLRLYAVTVWRQGDELNGPGTLIAPDPDRGGSGSDAKTWLPVQGNPVTTKFAVLPFEPVTDVVKISIAIEQRAYTAVSLSELMFMEYDPSRSLQDDISALFVGGLDGPHTELAPGVSQEAVDALRQRLNSGEKDYYLYTAAMADELDLAEAILRRQPTGSSVLTGLDVRSGAADSAKYSQGGSELQPLGAAAGAGDEITVYASIPGGQTVTVYASQYNAEASQWLQKIGTLRNGRNILTVPKIGSQNTPRGGSLYVTCGGQNPEQVSLTVRRAVKIPVLELSDWYDLSETARRDRIRAYAAELESYVSAQGVTDAAKTTDWHNVTEISMPAVLLSLPALAVLNGSGKTQAEREETLYSNVLAWEDLMHICKTTQGIDNTYRNSDMTTRQNIRCMQMFSGAFMYAAGSHIGIGYGSCAGMVCGKPISALGTGAGANGLFGWGIAHEIGHNMDKLGRAEITNNLYSLMVQTYDGRQNTLSSRLEKSGKYPAIFTKTAQGLPGESNNVFVQLGLYWQLHLAYDGGDRPMDFYNRFFKAWKAGTYFGGETGYADKVARTASAVAGRNLEEFFTRWGMVLSDGTRAALANYPAEPRAVWYLSDQSRRARLAGTQPAGGSASVTALLTADNEITLTITPSFTGAIQGYEIRRSSDGGRTFRPIAFTAETTYKDVVGSANHRTYTYEVVAYDILGGAVAAAQSGEVRVAYDKTVPETAYTVARSGDAVTFTLTEETAVSGLKVKNAPESGDFSVEIRDGGGKTHTARSGSFGQGSQAVDDQSSYLTYFQKPGAGAEDTRIWTYDAKTVTVTGIPSSVPEGDIQLISYAGDDVAFLEEGSVGVLAEDYPYLTASGTAVLPAGTLVITGTYRGDPLYQTVKIEGRFTRTAVNGDGTETESVELRPLDGRALLFAEVPEDGAVSDISDGLFIFIPNVQREAELQGDQSDCGGENLLPSQMRAVLSRTDLPDSPESQRVTAETLWIDTPGGADLPAIVLKE